MLKVKLRLDGLFPIDSEKQESPDHLVGGLRFSSGIAIETTKPESNMALVSEETTIVRSPFMQKLKIIRKPKR